MRPEEHSGWQGSGVVHVACVPDRSLDHPAFVRAGNDTLDTKLLHASGLTARQQITLLFDGFNPTAQADHREVALAQAFDLATGDVERVSRPRPLRVPGLADGGDACAADEGWRRCDGSCRVWQRLAELDETSRDLAYALLRAGRARVALRGNYVLGSAWIELGTRGADPRFDSATEDALLAAGFALRPVSADGFAYQIAGEAQPAFVVVDERDAARGVTLPAGAPIGAVFTVVDGGGASPLRPTVVRAPDDERIDGEVEFAITRAGKVWQFIKREPRAWESVA